MLPSASAKDTSEQQAADSARESGLSAVPSTLKNNRVYTSIHSFSQRQADKTMSPKRPMYIQALPDLGKQGACTRVPASKQSLGREPLIRLLPNAPKGRRGHRTH